MTAYDDLSKDNSKDTANFIRLALQDYVNSGETAGPDTSQVFMKEFKKEKVQKLTPDIDDVNAQKRVVDVEQGDLRFRADFLTELDGRGAKGQNLDEMMVNIARTYFNAGVGTFDIISDVQNNNPAGGDAEGPGLEDGDAKQRFQLDDEAIVNGGGLVGVSEWAGEYRVQLGHDSDLPNLNNSAGDLEEIQLRFADKHDALEYAAFARLVFDMLSGDVDLVHGDQIEGTADGIRGGLGAEAEAKMQQVIDNDRFDFTDWAFDDAGQDVRKDTAQFLRGAIEADGTDLGAVYVKVEEAVKTESLQFGSSKADIESGDLVFRSDGMEALTGRKGATLDEVLIDAAREVFGANTQFFDDNPEAGSDDADQLFQLDDSAIVAGDGTVSLRTSGNPNYDFTVDLGIVGDKNEMRLTFGDGNDLADTWAALADAKQFAAFAEITMAILSGDIEKSGSDYSAKGGYTPDIGGDVAYLANDLVTEFLATDDFGLFV